MATITTRSGKGSALSHAELDANFSQHSSTGNMVIQGTWGSAAAYANWGGILCFNGSDADAQGNYYIGTNYENYGGGYSKLDHRWHTGMRFGSQLGYGGIRFFDSEDLGTLRLQIEGTSGYIYKYVWMYINTSGFYSDTNNAHWHPNDTSSYTQWMMRGSKNGYGGIRDDYSAVNVAMYDSAGNGGVYREANGRWYLYHNLSNNSMGVGTSTTSSSYYLYVGGAIYSTSDIVAYSDARAKENVFTVDNALDKVLRMRGVYYNMIKGEKEYDRRRRVGVIAQETLEVLPEVVTYDKENDRYGVDYGNITGLLIEAIKELKGQVDALKLKLGEA